MKRLITTTICFCIFSACNNMPNETVTESLSHRNAVQYILDNEDNFDGSIVPWTNDSIKASCPELVMLIDPLYQFQPTDTLEKGTIYLLT